MDNALFRLPLYTFCSGFLLNTIEHIYIKIIMSIFPTWTEEIENSILLINIVGSLFFIFLIGLYLRKQYNLKQFFISCSMLVIYFIFIFLFEKLLNYLNVYTIAIYYLYLPAYLFSFIATLLSQFTQPETISFYKIIYFFYPYLFLLFAKKKKSH